MVNFQNALKISHYIMKLNLQMGDVAVDGTMGKGRDTLFLRSLVGSLGKVYAFDIQEEAIVQTSALLKEHGMEENVVLIHDSHERILDYVHQPIKGAMFNLGYLPGGDHRITTKAPSTVKAVQSCMDLLLPGGLITVCIYYGHLEGEIERQSILSFCETLDPKQFTVIRTEFINQPNKPPILITIQKNEGQGKFL